MISELESERSWRWCDGDAELSLRRRIGFGRGIMSYGTSHLSLSGSAILILRRFLLSKLQKKFQK